MLGLQCCHALLELGGLLFECFALRLFHLALLPGFVGSACALLGGLCGARELCAYRVALGGPDGCRLLGGGAVNVVDCALEVRAKALRDGFLLGLDVDAVLHDLWQIGIHNGDNRVEEALGQLIAHGVGLHRHRRGGGLRRHRCHWLHRLGGSGGLEWVYVRLALVCFVVGEAVVDVVAYRVV